MIDHKRLTELDALRGLAALSVCLFHFDYFNYGVTGVDLFFMISGFVIFMSVSNAKNINDFIFSRIIRLYPVYWLSIFIAVLAYYVKSNTFPPHHASYILGNLLMIQPVFRTPLLVDAYWTLYVEILFYLFIILIWYLRQIKNIEYVVCISLFLMMVLNAGYLLFHESSKIYVKIFVITRGLLPIISHFNFFAAGIIFYQIYTKGYTPFRIFLLLCSFPVIMLVHHTGGKVFYIMNIEQHLLCSLVYYLVFTLVVFKKINFLRNRVFLVLGSISYPLYLIHQSFGLALRDYISPFTGSLLSGWVAIAASLILAYLITYYFDFPVRAWLKKTYHIKTSQLAEARALD